MNEQTKYLFFIKFNCEIKFYYVWTGHRGHSTVARFLQSHHNISRTIQTHHKIIQTEQLRSSFRSDILRRSDITERVK